MASSSSNTSIVHIPVQINPQLGLLFYIDMVHDFSDSFDLTKDFELDLQLFTILFSSVFGEAFANLINEMNKHIIDGVGTKILNPSNYISVAHEYAYTLCTNENKYFWGLPQERNKDILMTKFNTLEDANEFGSMMTHYNADWAVLQAGTYYGGYEGIDTLGFMSWEDKQKQQTFRVIRPVHIVEDAVQSTKQLSMVYSENLNTIERMGNNDRNVISMKTLPGLYDAANNKFIVSNSTIQQNPLGLNDDCYNIFYNSIQFSFRNKDNSDQIFFMGEMKTNAQNDMKVNSLYLTTSLFEQMLQLIDRQIKKYVDESTRSQFLQSYIDKTNQINIDVIMKNYPELEFIRKKQDVSNLNNGIQYFISQYIGIASSIEILFSEKSAVYNWITNNWEFPKSAEMFINIVKELSRSSYNVNDPNVISQIIDKVMNDYDKISDITTIGNLFSSFKESYYGEYVGLNNKNDEQVISVGSSNIAPKIIELVLTRIPDDLTEGITNKENVNKLLLRIFTIGICSSEKFSMEEKDLKIITGITCKKRSCEYLNILTSTSLGSETNEDIGLLSYNLSNEITNAILNKISSNYNSSIQDFLRLVVNFKIFDISDISKDTRYNITNILSQLGLYYADPEVFLSQVSIQFSDKDCATLESQNPSVTSVASEFRFECLKIYNNLSTQKPGLRLKKINKNVLDENVSGARQDGISTELGNNMQVIVRAILSNNQDVCNYKKLFFILFKKTFGDFSQIAITNFLSKNPQCGVSNKVGVIVPQVYWAVSFDTMMTIISLYYGSNIIRQGISSGTLDKGFVNYGFANYKIFEDILKEQIKEDDINVSLTQLLQTKNQLYPVPNNVNQFITGWGGKKKNKTIKLRRKKLRSKTRSKTKSKMKVKRKYK